MGTDQNSHHASACFWLREKHYILEALHDLKARLGIIDSKLDAFTVVASDAKVYSKAVDDLEHQVSLSREEIATLKVKASLFGIGAAAALELAFVVAKGLFGK